MSPKKRHKKTIQKQDRARQAALKNARAVTARLFREHWSQLRPATRGMPNALTRSLWRGMPNGGNADPLQLAGLELVLVWFATVADREAWTNASDVSAIEIQEYLGSRKPSCRGTCHLYKARLLQLVDPDSPYGALLAKQRHLGAVDSHEDFGDVSERSIVLLFNVSPPTEAESRAFRRLGGAAPQLLLVGPPQPLRSFALEDPRPVLEIAREQSLTDSLSDLEVDRVWELFMATGDWLICPRERVIERAKLRQQLLDAEQRLLAEAQASGQERARLTDARDEAARAKALADAELRSAREAFAALQQEQTATRARAKSELQRLHNEVGRLRGVRLEILREVSGLTSDADPALQKRFTEKITHTQEQEAALPARIAEAVSTLERTEQQWQQAMRDLEAQLAQRVSNAADATDRLSRAEENLARVAQCTTRLEQARSRLACVFDARQ